MPGLTNHADLPADRAGALAKSVETLETLEQVIRWGLELPSEKTIVEVVVQDEYCHDVVMPWEADFHLVFDTT